MSQISKINIAGIDYDVRDKSKFTSVAHADLVALRDSGGLVEGAFYRITDYMTTTAQFGTLSAGHPFDVIVLALSKNALAEEAYAVHSERDTEGYFANSNLSAWKIWYSLDNDTAKFAWADAENGKGVIYRMIDEFNNDIPYDFKNILYSLDDAIVECEIQKYGSWFNGSFTRDSTNDKVINNEQYYAWFYKVTSGPNGSGICYTKEERISVDSILYNDSGSEFSDVKLLSVLSEVYTFGMSESADLSGNCHNNSIGVYITNSRQELNRITFGDHCYNNAFGYDCTINTFGNYCHSNTFGVECQSNSFGNNCNHNTFGVGCDNNVFGYSFNQNSFGNYCMYNSFRESASENAPELGFCTHNHFDDGCSYNVIWCAANSTNGNQLRNININKGVCGKEGAYNYIRIETLNSEHEINVNQIDGIVSVGEILSIRHATLKSLRDNGQLIAGQQYRIIDYITTTSQADTQSAFHQFDLIVTADDNKTLNEKARAIQHEGDTYFANSDLNAWEVWYCLDNDSERFAWRGEPETRTAKIYSPAGTEATVKYDLLVSHVVFDSKVFELKKGERVQILAGPPVYVTLSDDGKSIFLEDPTRYTPSHPLTVHFKTTGVIYRMIDEFGNDCPYDFKNIQFKRNLLSAGGGITEDGNEDFQAYCYTFSWEDDENVIMDASIVGNNGYILNDEGQISGTYGNVIKPYISYTGEVESPKNICQFLNDIVFLSTYSYEDRWYYGCYDNTFGNDCYNNSFGSNCRSNTFGNDCNSNTFGNECYSNTFGNECHNNTFVYGGSYNTFADNCYSNTLGESFCYNTFESGCHNNTFGNHCYYNTFGNECHNNTFGNDCFNNSFGSNCYSNTFGNDCNSNTFGEECYRNTFGDECNSNIFGNYCYSNTFTDEDGGAKCSHIKFDSEVYSVDIHYDDGNSTYTSIRNIHVYTGVKDTELIVGEDRNYETCFAMNSSGNVVEFCLADLKNS